MLATRRDFLGQAALGLGASLVGAPPRTVSASAAEALRLGWPGLAGPHSTFETTNAPLVEDLGQAKLLWESACRDFGRAKGGSQAYRTVEQFTAESIARMGSHPGSWSGPIVAEGLVFCSS